MISILAVRNVGTSMFLECYIIKGRVNGRVVKIVVILVD